MWSRQQTQVYSEEESYLPFLDQVIQAGQKDGRKAIIRLLKEAPKIRTRKSGPIRVQDGVDYSIRYARVGGRVSFQQKYHELLDIEHSHKFENMKYEEHLIPRLRGEFHPYAMHNCIQLLTLNDEGCRLWTEYAERNRIQYSGDYEYIFPSRRNAHRLGVAFFRDAKDRGEIPCAKRSREAGLRRAQRRRAKKPVLRKGWMPIHLDEPVAVRPSTSAASTRAGWRARSGLTWREYQSGVDRKPILSLVLPRNRPAPVAQIVLDAINRIYSRTVPVESGVLKHPDHKPRDPVSLPLQRWFPGVRHQEVLDVPKELPDPIRVYLMSRRKIPLVHCLVSSSGDLYDLLLRALGPKIQS